MRYDLIGPRRLRPALPEPLRASQPALVVAIPHLLSKADVELYKALRGHVEWLNKALEGRRAAEAWEAFEAPKRKGEAPTGLYERTKFWSKWEGPLEDDPVAHERYMDVSTPEHDHARLMAKRSYLMDKIQGHLNAGHSADHPVFQQRRKVLGQVSQKLRSYANRGISSTAEHHSDWQKHYARNFAGKYSPEHTDTGVTYHGRAANVRPTPEQRELHQKMAVPGPMHAPVETHLSTPKEFHISPLFGPTKEASPGVMPKVQGATTAIAKKPPEVGPRGAAVMQTPHVEKGERKSDNWISNKIRLLVHEGKPQDQAIATAYSMAGRARKSVPLFLSV